MRLLTEEEEDVHLDEGKRSEEDIFSIDYDVWIDEKSGDILVNNSELKNTDKKRLWAFFSAFQGFNMV